MKLPAIPVLLVPLLLGCNNSEALDAGPDAGANHDTLLSCTELSEPLRGLSPMLGSWEGQGWIEMGTSPREEFEQREEVRCGLAGELLVIEGEGTAAGQPVHRAFGIVSNDRASQGLRMRAYRAGYEPLDADFQITTDGLYTWSLDQGSTQVRFELDVSEDGVWREWGDHSYQGGPWTRFLEMELARTR